MYKYIAIDQYGNKIMIRKHPRKELIEACGIQHVSKMFVDRKDGHTYHTGYVVGRQWFRVYGLEGVKFERRVQ